MLVRQCAASLLFDSCFMSQTTRDGNLPLGSSTGGPLFLTRTLAGENEPKTHLASMKDILAVRQLIRRYRTNEQLPLWEILKRKTTAELFKHESTSQAGSYDKSSLVFHPSLAKWRDNCSSIAIDTQRITGDVIPADRQWVSHTFLQAIGEGGLLKCAVRLSHLGVR